MLELQSSTDSWVSSFVSLQSHRGLWGNVFADCAYVIRCTANKKPKHTIHYSTILNQGGDFSGISFSSKLRQKLQTKDRDGNGRITGIL